MLSCDLGYAPRTATAYISHAGNSLLTQSPPLASPSCSGLNSLSAINILLTELPLAQKKENTRDFYIDQITQRLGKEYSAPFSLASAAGAWETYVSAASYLFHSLILHPISLSPPLPVPPGNPALSFAQWLASAVFIDPTNNTVWKEAVETRQAWVIKDAMFMPAQLFLTWWWQGCGLSRDEQPSFNKHDLSKVPWMFVNPIYYQDVFLNVSWLNLVTASNILVFRNTPCIGMYLLSKVTVIKVTRH